jgi:hypothetical protein
MPSKILPVTVSEIDDALHDAPGLDVYLSEQYARWRVWMSKSPVFYMDLTNALLSLVSCFDFVISTYGVVDNDAINTVENVLLVVFVLDYLLRIAMSGQPCPATRRTTPRAPRSRSSPFVNG